jgi:endonuclease V-like protein UPF0215 family
MNFVDPKRVERSLDGPVVAIVNKKKNSLPPVLFGGQVVQTFNVL